MTAYRLGMTETKDVLNLETASSIGQSCGLYVAERNEELGYIVFTTDSKWLRSLRLYYKTGTIKATFDIPTFGHRSFYEYNIKTQSAFWNKCRNILLLEDNTVPAKRKNAPTEVFSNDITGGAEDVCLVDHLRFLTQELDSCREQLSKAIVINHSRCENVHENQSSLSPLTTPLVSYDTQSQNMTASSMFMEKVPNLIASPHICKSSIISDIPAFNVAMVRDLISQGLSKRALNEIMAKKTSPIYDTSGAATSWTCNVTIYTGHTFTGSGSKKGSAEREAATAALYFLIDELIKVYPMLAE